MTQPPTARHADATLTTRLYILLQHLIPQRWLSQRVHGIAQLRWRPFKALLIRGFARIYGVEMREALEPNLDAYPHFNAFFTRALRPDARPLDADPRALLCPVDAAISQIGRLAQGRIIQAKGHSFAVTELLGLDPGAPQPYTDGSFATLYLSPRDYHRIHMPLDGRLLRMTHIPGRLFSVNPTTTAQVTNLFARNERLVCHFETAVGPMALVLVGAIFVGGIETPWAGVITPPHGRNAPRDWDYGDPEPPLRLARGAEMGRFNMGSTVILLLPEGRVQWHATLAPGTRTRVGERLGTCVDDA